MSEQPKTTEAKHTPGPWDYDLRLNRTLPLGRDSAYGVWHGGVLIADVSGRPRSKHFEEQANARLISAAPYLLAACKAAAPWLGVLIAEGAHLRSAAPGAAEQALLRVNDAIAKAQEPDR